MPLAPGTRVGPYDVQSSLGAGGMGEVYRAHDAKLGRDVALKILPDAFASDPDRLARFEREARTLAALNHPNIAHIYGLEDSSGVRALVMELVAGEDLSQRIARGPIPMAEALPIASQIAEALEAAHELGIVHRDLKPANVKVTSDGTVKVLDFGLAKAVDTTVAGQDLSPANLANSPTLTAAFAAGYGQPGTQMGMILGTAAYMAPEQARGKAVDRRADIWAFGVVLYEMLTGRRAFAGDEASDVLAAVIKDAPPFDALPADTPASIRRLLRRCLEKDRRDRLGDASAVRLEIKEALAGEPPAAALPAPPPAARRLSPALIVGALALAVLAGLSAWALKPAPRAPTPIVTRFSVTLPPGLAWTRTSRHVIAVSPDGARLAYIANEQLFVRTMDQLDGAAVAGVRDPSEVFFSPDGLWIGFLTAGSLQKVSLTGGAPVTLCATNELRGASWRSDAIVFGGADGIMRVAAGGGTPELLAKRQGNRTLGNPQLLPGGRALLFATTSEAGAWDDGDIVVERLDTHERKALVRGGTDPRYLATGHLVYSRAGDLLAVPFDLSALEVRGTPVVLVNGVVASTSGITGSVQYSFSDNGTLVYLPGGSAVADSPLVSADRDGREQPISLEPNPSYPRISPDGSRVAFNATVNGNTDIFIREPARNIRTRLTFEPSADVAPLWTPDGKRIIYWSGGVGGQGLLSRAADGTGTAERLTVAQNTQYPYALTPDGETLLFIETTANATWDIYSLPMKGPQRTPHPVLATQFDERRPHLSPDGRWMVYQSNESGPFEVYVRPFPNVDSGRWQVSAGGGSTPIWSANGREIVYRQGQTLQHVSVSTTPTFSSGTPALLFNLQGVPADSQGVSYAMGPDGHFVIIKTTDNMGPIYRVVVNWQEEVRARAK